MARTKQSDPAEQTLEALLDKVANARGELLAVERTLERLRADIRESQRPKNGKR
jgi:hypothetical protein